MTADVTVGLYHVHDFVLRSSTAHENPFLVKLSATFEHESGLRIENVPGFHDGQDRWVVRFSPLRLGLWRGRTQSADKQLDGVELGPVLCTSNENPKVHGRVRISPRSSRRFAFDDGAPFVPIGFECDWLFAFHQRLGQPKGKPVDPAADAFEPAMDLLGNCGFNYIVTNLYAHRGFSDPALPWVLSPPDMFVFGGTNDEPDHTRLNVDFFRDFDAMMGSLHRKGIIVHLMIQVQNKQVKWPARRSSEDQMFWTYVVARYQAYCNVVWDVSKESFNLFKQTGSHDYTLSRIELIRKLDAYGHLVTAHDTETGSWARTSFADQGCDFLCDQIHLEGQNELPAVRSVRRYNRETVRRFRNQDKPYMDAEYGYELAEEVLPTYTASGRSRSWQDMLMWTWGIYVGGGYGTYYHSNTSWDLVKFDPEPSSWHRYKYLSDFLAMMDLEAMAPDNDFVERGMCLAEPGRQYFVYLPEGGDETIDLTAAPRGSLVKCTWLDAHTGQRVENIVDGRSFTVALPNPLDEPNHPCAVYLRAVQQRRRHA